MQKLITLIAHSSGQLVNYNQSYYSEILFVIKYLLKNLDCRDQALRGLAMTIKISLLINKLLFI
jgi:hypothetical protein